MREYLLAYKKEVNEKLKNNSKGTVDGDKELKLKGELKAINRILKHVNNSLFL